MNPTTRFPVPAPPDVDRIMSLKQHDPAQATDGGFTNEDPSVGLDDPASNPSPYNQVSIDFKEA
jgi:hypothetical protein